MKIKVTASVLALSVIFCLGCSARDGEGQNGGGENGRQAMARQTQGAAARQGAAAVSDEVKAAATRTVSGTVESIVGNEVTLIVTDESEGGITRQSGREEGGAPRDSGSGMGQPSQRPEGEPREGGLPRRAGTADADSGDGPAQPAGAGMAGEAYGGSQPAGAETAGESGEQPAQKTAAFILPVGMSIGTGDFASVTAGSSITIYFGAHPDDGSEIITAVELSGGRR